MLPHKESDDKKTDEEQNIDGDYIVDERQRPAR